MRKDAEKVFLKSYRTIDRVLLARLANRDDLRLEICGLILFWWELAEAMSEGVTYAAISKDLSRLPGVIRAKIFRIKDHLVESELELILEALSEIETLIH